MQRGKELAELRKGVGLTQRKAGEALGGISGAAVSSWETGTSSPEWTKLRALDELYRANGRVLEMFEAAPATPDFAARLDRIESTMVSRLDQLDAGMRDLTDLAANAVQVLRELRSRLPSPHASPSVEPPVDH